MAFSHLYWTQTRDSEKRGQIWRMSTEGSRAEQVFTSHMPLIAVKIDHESTLQIYFFSGIFSIRFLQFSVYVERDECRRRSIVYVAS